MSAQIAAQHVLQNPRALPARTGPIKSPTRPLPAQFSLPYPQPSEPQAPQRYRKPCPLATLPWSA